ncbi:MAG: hypothetical protein IJH34_13540 [Romboutsia sp.]|nr:hypothetical protein [Romboutsia sp.]
MKRKLRKTISLIYILINILMPVSVLAQSSERETFETLSIDEGLSNEYVTSIFQDSKGYMWIGTIDGLNRYDGERITVYNCSIDSDNSLSSTYINDIEEDSRGNIWVATDSGLDIIDRSTNTIINFNDLERKNKDKIKNLKITSLLKDNTEDTMWVGTENGLMKIDIKNDKMDTLYHDENNKNSLTNSYITSLEYGLNDNNICVGTTYGINIVNKKSLEVSHFESILFENSFFVYNLELDNLNNNMWISTKRGIFVYNQKENEDYDLFMIDNEGIKEYNKKDNKMYNLNLEEEKNAKVYNNEFVLSDSQNNIWLSSSKGIKKYSIEQKKFINYSKNSNIHQSLTSNSITCFYEDFNGTIWIGTDKGVNIVNKNNQFSFNNQYNYINGILHDKNIVSILQQNGYCFVASKYDGIYIFNEDDSSLVDTIYTNNDNKLGSNNEHITGLYKLDEDDILVATNKYVVLLNINNGEFTQKSYESVYYEELNYLYSDGEFAWSSNTNEFRAVNIKTNEKTSYSDNLKKFDINPGKITYILPDLKDKNILWLGGQGVGLIKYHKKNGVIKKYMKDSSNNNLLINDHINCMAFDDFGNLWIGTNIGLSKFNIKEDKFTSYTTSDGLTNNFINSILLDNDNNLWISTNKGLNKFDIEKEKIITFTKMDGIYGYQFNVNSSFKDDNGMMIFGSTNGITFFNPKNIKNSIVNENKVVIGEIFIGKSKINYDNKELVLEYDHKDLSMTYFLPIYENLNTITYEYMIEGLDKTWIYLDRKSYLNIKSLDSGKYTLKIRARDGHGNLTEETTMDIKVKTPFWKTPIAYLIYTIVLSVIAYYILNYVKILQNLVNQKTMKLNKQLEENKKLSEELINNEKFKNNYFVNLSHELRTPINVISSILQLSDNLIDNNTMTYEKAKDYTKIVRRNCNSLLKIINDIIDCSKIETGNYKINKTNNDIVYIVEEAALNMSDFINEKGLSLIIDPDIEEKIISFDEVEIERCVINLLGNAVKFTHEGGQIKVYIKEVEDYIEITIEDNGIGISEEDQEFIFKRFSQVEGNGATKASSSGIGLTLVKYIVDLHGGYIRLESELNKGSKFTIGLPDIVEEITSENI